ncbi:VOC family protein [Agreia sp.]|uniref:VOC family protein n=1 Tax=Agreia sp. TaxID=1872416 RepID=UPI0035BC54BC
MERVTGIGGFFFVARDPDSLARWYAEHLGVDAPPQNYGDPSWRQDSGSTVFAPMDATAPHFAEASSGWALNFRVADLDAMVDQLRAAGVAVVVDPEVYPNGRFASLSDPEGNGIELWQPEGDDA